MSTDQIPTDDMEPETSFGAPYPRPAETILSLPMNLRWEVTRRHGYYQAFWKMARSNGDAADPLLRQAASVFMQLINVSGDPPNPATSADDLGTNELAEAFRTGPIAPLTYRQIFRLLTFGLRGPMRKLIGQILAGGADEDLTTDEGTFYALECVNDPRLTELDVIVPGMQLSVNPHAPSRAISEALESLLRETRARLGISESRRRHDKIPGYLDVWDMREGWTGAEYNGRNELKFREIARALRIPLNTVTSRYRNAFEQITGHSFSPTIWWHVFGVLKVSRYFDDAADPRLSQNRPRRSHERSETGNSRTRRRVLLVDSDQRIVGQDANSELTLRELVCDIESLIARGLTDEQIVKALDLLNPRAGDAVAYVRSRRDDGLDTVPR